MILVTGGAGFIGSNFIYHWLESRQESIVNLDKLTYAGNMNNLVPLAQDSRHNFVYGDIGDRALVRELLYRFRPSAVINFAAETHVDRSIYHPENFIETNIDCSFNLLDECFDYWRQLNADEKEKFRFLNISTDEVYGSLAPEDPPSTELSPFAPNSPYAASKASFDHIVRSYHRTFAFPVLTTHCSNNFGPFQFPEKLIPLVIVNALQGKPLPIYGDGQQLRDWIYVTDHCKAIRIILEKGTPGEQYNIGHETKMTNLEIVKRICKLLDEMRPDSPYHPHETLIEFVKDRPGHDRRYALDSAKIKSLGWDVKESFADGLRKTVAWYLENQAWVSNIQCGDYHAWISTHYGDAPTS